MLVPSNDPRLGENDTASGSPFVIAIVNAGIGGLPHVINAALLTSAWSAASSDLYTSSRALYGLALSRNAPSIFRWTTRKGLPLPAIITGCAFALLAYMGSTSGSSKVFGWFVNMTSVSGLMTWFGICVTYLRFRKGFVAQGFDKSILPYRSPLQPYAAWYGAISCPIVCLVSFPIPASVSYKITDHVQLKFSGWDVFLADSWDTASFVTNYLPLVLFPILFLISNMWTRYRMGVWRRPLRPMEMDFVSNIKEVEDDSYEEPPPRNWAERFWMWLVSNPYLERILRALLI